MRYADDLTANNRHLIAEAQRLRLRLQQALEELEEIRHQAERQRREAYQLRITAGLNSRQKSPVRNRN